MPCSYFNVLDFFQEIQRIFGVCPHCDEIFRLSDATLFAKTRPPQSPFDRLDVAIERIERQIDRFVGMEHEIRALAQAKGRRAAMRKLRAMSPYLRDRRIEPQDVSVLFHPVDYVIFHGMVDDCCSRVEFLDQTACNAGQERIQRSLEKALRAGNIEWRIFRITADGRVGIES